MPQSMNFLIAEENFIYLNLLSQITFLSLTSLVLASQFKKNAVVRYALLYSSLLSLILLCVSSVFIQARGVGFLHFYIESPTAYFEQLLPGLSGDAANLSVLQILAESLSTLADSGVHPGSSSLSSIFNVFNWIIFKLPFFMLLQILWVSGFFIFTIGLLRSIHNAGRIAQRSIKLSAPEYQLFNSVLNQDRFGISQLHCRKSANIKAPVLVGITFPVLLVPNDFFECFDESGISAILCHEVAHVMRKDPIFNFLQKLILTVFWFHPLVHRMDRMISRAREEICDNYVLAQERAVDYGEILLRLNLNQSSKSQDTNNAFQSDVVLGVFSSDWNLEQRIGDLLNHKREILMHLSQRSKTILNISVVAAALTVSACQVAAQNVTDQALAQSDREDVVVKQPVDSGVTQTLGPRIAEGIAEIQGLMRGGEDSEPDMERAKGASGRALRTDERFREAALLNFYTNYYLSLENYIEATNTSEQILTLEIIRPDIHQRILRVLGQLYAALENWDASISYYEQWQTESDQTDHVSLQGLSYAYYQLEQFSYALNHWLAYMDLPREDGVEFTRENHSYLNGLYFTLEQWDDSLETTKEMILLYNTPKDWENLRAIYKKLDEQDAGAA